MVTEESLKLYYSIGEVAEMFGVNTSLIRFWEKEFDVINPHKNKKGRKKENSSGRAAPPQGSPALPARLCVGRR